MSVAAVVGCCALCCSGAGVACFLIGYIVGASAKDGWKAKTETLQKESADWQKQVEEWMAFAAVEHPACLHLLELNKSMTLAAVEYAETLKAYAAKSQATFDTMKEALTKNSAK